MKKIKKDDTVIVIAGKDKGKTGKILAVVKDGEYYLVEGINEVKKHVKANPQANQQGGIVAKNMPIHRSNVMSYDAASKKGSRVGIRILKDGQRARFYKGSDQLLEVKE